MGSRCTWPTERSQARMSSMSICTSYRVLAAMDSAIDFPRAILARPRAKSSTTLPKRFATLCFGDEAASRRSPASAIIRSVAKQVPPDLVLEALGQVHYPGYSTDIVTLGIVEDI